MMVGGGEQVEIVSAPTVATLVKRMNDRPVWQIIDKAPLYVDSETFQRARTEMQEALARQGRAVVAADWAPLPNFLLLGVPVVMNG